MWKFRVIYVSCEDSFWTKLIAFKGTTLAVGRREVILNLTVMSQNKGGRLNRIRPNQ